VGAARRTLGGMEIAERYGKVAAGFTRRVVAVPAGAWAALDGADEQTRLIAFTGRRP